MLRGFQRIFIAISIIWFSYFIYQSYRYLGEEWSYEHFKIKNNDRASEYRDDVCASFSKDAFNKLINPFTHDRDDKKPLGLKQEWFRVNTEEIEFINTSSNIYETSWSDKYCQFNFKKPIPFKERITYRTKKYFIYSLFPIPAYLLIIFIINGFRKRN